MIKVLFHYCVVVFAIVESCPSGTRKFYTDSTKYPGIQPDIGSGGYDDRTLPDLDLLPPIPPLPPQRPPVVPRVLQSVVVKTSSGRYSQYTQGLGNFDYITLQICTPVCCQVERFGHGENGTNKGFVPGKTVPISDLDLDNCRNFQLSDLTAVRLTHGNTICFKSIGDCRKDQEFQGWHSDSLALIFDDGTDVICDLPKRIHFEQVDVVNRCKGDLIDVIKPPQPGGFYPPIGGGPPMLGPPPHP